MVKVVSMDDFHRVLTGISLTSMPVKRSSSGVSHKLLSEALTDLYGSSLTLRNAYYPVPQGDAISQMFIDAERHGIRMIPYYSLTETIEPLPTDLLRFNVVVVMLATAYERRLSRITIAKPEVPDGYYMATFYDQNKFKVRTDVIEYHEYFHWQKIIQILHKVVPFKFGEEFKDTIFRAELFNGLVFDAVLDLFGNVYDLQSFRLVPSEQVYTKKEKYRNYYTVHDGQEIRVKKINSTTYALFDKNIVRYEKYQVKDAWLV